MTVRSVFQVGNNKDRIEVKGYGQEAANAAVETFPLHRIVLTGFMINGVFKKADMTPHWERNQAKK